MNKKLQASSLNFGTDVFAAFKILRSFGRLDLLHADVGGRELLDTAYAK